MSSDKSKSLAGHKILVIDDHRNIRLSLKLSLEEEGAIVDEAESLAKAKEKLGDLSRGIDHFPFDLMLLDIRLPDGSGLQILKLLSEAGLAQRTIMISGEGTVTEAFQATQMGAFDYIEKPFAQERIIVSVIRCLEFNDLRKSRDLLQKKVLQGYEILGNHPAVLEMHAVIARVARSNGRVLIIGETGTGKELVARSIHRQSERAKQPLIKVNCAAIPHSLIESELFGHEKGSFTGAVKQRRGLFEQANGGTLFLDEIGELSLDVQAKLLRVLETGELSRIGSEKTLQVDVRLLAATHRDIPAMVESKEFRQDLYYRLNVVTINVPALRERADDIPLIAKSFLTQACEEHSLGARELGPNAVNQLKAYRWPGNIRELKNVIERTAILNDEEAIDDIDDLKQKIAADSSHFEEDNSAVDGSASFRFGSETMTWEDFHKSVDRSYLIYILQKAQGNVSEAARILCLERAYLHRLMKKLGVQRGIIVSD